MGRFHHGLHWKVQEEDARLLPVRNNCHKKLACKIYTSDIPCRLFEENIISLFINMTKIIIFADLIPQLSWSCNNICILLKHQSGKRPVLWIRKYFLWIRTRIRGPVILRYEFRSRSLNYGTVLVLIRITPGHFCGPWKKLNFCGHWKKIVVKQGSESKIL